MKYIIDGQRVIFANTPSDALRTIWPSTKFELVIRLGTTLVFTDGKRTFRVRQAI